MSEMRGPDGAAHLAFMETPTMDQFSNLSLERAQEILAAQPFSRLLNARITAIGMGTAELAIPIRRDLLQHHGFVHGCPSSPCSR